MSTSPTHQECFLYVDAEGVEQVSAELATRLGPATPFDRFEAGGLEIVVVKNGLRLPGRPDTFIDWTAKVEVYTETTPDSDVVRFVAELMGFLREHGHRVVAACDFEDDLPQTDLN